MAKKKSAQKKEIANESATEENSLAGWMEVIDQSAKEEQQRQRDFHDSLREPDLVIEGEYSANCYWRVNGGIVKIYKPSEHSPFLDYNLSTFKEELVRKLADLLEKEPKELTDK